MVSRTLAPGGHSVTVQGQTTTDRHMRFKSRVPLAMGAEVQDDGEVMDSAAHWR